ncbi:hypothetical protein [Parasediminibacterium sp. JCM 36343]|uniref:hypothetical protein n=1 Tax=Parasediminibacterium sp. JCM 36343 TaxID=3374279 RepID=UPI0039798312
MPVYLPKVKAEKGEGDKIVAIPPQRLEGALRNKKEKRLVSFLFFLIRTVSDAPGVLTPWKQRVEIDWKVNEEIQAYSEQPILVLRCAIVVD